MALFKVTRGKGGSRTISQLNTGEEGQLAHNKTLREAEERARERAKKNPLEHKDTPMSRPPTWTPCSAYRALAEGMHKHPVSWAEKFVKKLETVDEVDRIRLMETSHPKYEGGRLRMMGILDDRRAELDPTIALNVVTEEEINLPENVESPCTLCSFVAGSPEGLQAHMEATHTEL